MGDAEGLVQVKMTHVRACKEGSGLERSGEERREEKRGAEVVSRSVLRCMVCV